MLETIDQSGTNLARIVLTLCRSAKSIVTSCIFLFATLV